VLFRVFPWDRRAAATEAGGALYVPRDHQGRSRHDAPAAYGALYASRRASSAAAEFLSRFRAGPLPAGVFQGAGGRRWSIAAIDDARLGSLLDLDDPNELAARMLRPSEVATLDREVTQAVAERLFEEGRRGFQWWSTIEASWMNVTLFAERAVGNLRLVETPLPLDAGLAEVVEAAEVLEIQL
jgi:hypothetical protein